MNHFPFWNIRPTTLDLSEFSLTPFREMNFVKGKIKPLMDWGDGKLNFDDWRLDHFEFDHKGHHSRFPSSGRDRQRPEVAPDQDLSVTIQEIDHGHVVGKVEATDDTGVTKFRLVSHNPDSDKDGAPAFSIAADGTLSISDLDDVDFGANGEIRLAIRAHDAAGNVSAPQIVTLSLQSDPLVPTDTPFGYNVGINYESWESGRTGYSISADLDQITEYFKLIKTYHAAAVGTSNPTTPIIDSTQAEVINYVVATSDVELVMGTASSALAQGGFGTPWSAGLMTDKAYTDAWVQMLIDAFGGAANVEQHLKAILLGNEIDANGPPPNDPLFNDYSTWIQTSFDNLQASLRDAGLGSIPVSTTIANYGSTNVVSVQITQYINDNWSADWNDGTPFVLYNQYTQDSMQSTDFKPVEDYFELVQTQVPNGLEVFIGETGYSSFNGAQNQASVYQQIFDWLDGQESSGGKTVPIFPFVAFDRPSFDTTPTPQEADFGIFGEDANSQPTGLKPDLDGLIPSWTTTPITALSLDNDHHTDHDGNWSESWLKDHTDHDGNDDSDDDDGSDHHTDHDGNWSESWLKDHTDLNDTDAKTLTLNPEDVFDLSETVNSDFTTAMSHNSLVILGTGDDTVELEAPPAGHPAESGAWTDPLTAPETVIDSETYKVLDYVEPGNVLASVAVDADATIIV